MILRPFLILNSIFEEATPPFLFPLYINNLMYCLLALWFLSVANAVKRAIDYKPLIVFRWKLSSIKTTVIMGTKCLGFY